MVNSHFPCKIQNGGFTRLRKFFNENKLEGVSIVKIFTDTWEKETVILWLLEPTSPLLKGFFTARGSENSNFQSKNVRTGKLLKNGLFHAAKELSFALENGKLYAFMDS